MEREKVEQELQKINQRLEQAQKQVEQIKGMRMYVVEKACKEGIMEVVNTPQGQNFKFTDQKEDSDETEI